MVAFVASLATTGCPPLLWNIDCGPPPPDDQELCDLIAEESTCADTGGGCLEVRCSPDRAESLWCFSGYAGELTTVYARPEDVDAVLADQDAIALDYYCDAWECTDEPVIIVGCRENLYGRSTQPPVPLRRAGR